MPDPTNHSNESSRVPEAAADALFKRRLPVGRETLNADELCALNQEVRDDLAAVIPAIHAEIRERLTDDDGPVLLALREAISADMEGFGFRDEEGEEVFANHAAVESFGNEVSDRVKAALYQALGEQHGD